MKWSNPSFIHSLHSFSGHSLCSYNEIQVLRLGTGFIEIKDHIYALREDKATITAWGGQRRGRDKKINTKIGDKLSDTGKHLQAGGKGGEVLNNSFQGEDPTEPNYNEWIRMIKIKKAVRTMQTWGTTCKTGTKAWQQNVEWAEIRSKRWLWYQCEGLLGKTVELEIKVTYYILSYGRYREKRRKWFLHSETGKSLDCLPDFWLEHLMSHSLFLEACTVGSGTLSTAPTSE